MKNLTDYSRLKDLKKQHQEAKARWFSLLHSDRDEPEYFQRLEAASLDYTRSAEAHIAFWDVPEGGAV